MTRKAAVNDKKKSKKVKMHWNLIHLLTKLKIKK